MVSRTAVFFAVCATIVATNASPFRVKGSRSTEKVSYTNCGSASDYVTIDNLSVSPSSGFTSGQTVSVTTVGTVKKPIPEGSVVYVNGQLDGSVFFMDTRDLCSDIQTSMGLTCPVPAQEYTSVRAVELPQVPVGDIFTLVSNATTSDGESLFCLEFTIDLRS